ncbi:protein-serine/threonine phosphatase [Salvia divinorum]|uniref:protein-serine/threonine phosphatase n=1 Tax=Salvia divinorum TaxID=28513 RepID=A0ABD1H8K2_SALDI
MMTKLRPFVHTFLEEASKLFEMWIYTMGSLSYASDMAELLDPGDKYFHSRFITLEDSTHEKKKRLNIVLGRESTVLIVDDTWIWKKDKDNCFQTDFNGRTT